MTDEIQTTENIFEARAREIVCVPGFCGYADDRATGMSDEEAARILDKMIDNLMRNDEAA